MSLEEIADNMSLMKKLIVSFSGIVVVIIAFIMYFASSAELSEFKQQYYSDKDWSRFEYLEKTVADIENRFRCYSIVTCQPIMDAIDSSIHKNYRDKKLDEQRLRKKLFPTK